jgi:hypothetical protein
VAQGLPFRIVTVASSDEPPFWEDELAEIPFCKSLLSSYHQIRSEVLRFIDKPGALIDFPRYDIKDADGLAKIPLYQNSWKAIPCSQFAGEFFSTKGDDRLARYARELVSRAKENCPTVADLIGDLETLGLVANCFISKLNPGSIINPHGGRTNQFMRIHMGLDCDPGCVITVGNQQRVWEDGKIIAFKDGGPYPHSVQHRGTKRRIIISFDLDLDYLKGMVPRLKEFN